MPGLCGVSHKISVFWYFWDLIISTQNKLKNALKQRNSLVSRSSVTRSGREPLSRTENTSTIQYIKAAEPQFLWNIYSIHAEILTVKAITNCEHISSFLCFLHPPYLLVEFEGDNVRDYGSLSVNCLIKTIRRTIFIKKSYYAHLTNIANLINWLKM